MRLYAERMRLYAERWRALRSCRPGGRSGSSALPPPGANHEVAELSAQLSVLDVGYPDGKPEQATAHRVHHERALRRVFQDDGARSPLGPGIEPGRGISTAHRSSPVR